jgi:hypothetical protein
MPFDPQSELQPIALRHRLGRPESNMVTDYAFTILITPILNALLLKLTCGKSLQLITVDHDGPFLQGDFVIKKSNVNIIFCFDF